MPEISVRFRVRRRTAASWVIINEVLLDAELGLESDTRKFKFGDGVTVWNSLPYASGPPLGAGVATFLETPTSANLRAAVTDETGTGALVFAESPTLVTPALGTPSSLNLMNATSLPVSGITPSTVTALGVGSLEVGHASDTTLTRPSAGNLAIEGNLIYRAGGTDVPITDGGTGSSTAGGAATNLGLGTGDTPSFAGVVATGANAITAGLAATTGIIYFGTSKLTDIYFNGAFFYLEGSLGAKITGSVNTSSYTVATLPSASTHGAGARVYVTDANSTTFAAVVAGGGANAVPVTSDGTNWRIG